MEGQPMSRQLASNKELTKMINYRIKKGKELDGNCRDVTVSGVQRYAEPDEAGCNWHVYFQRGPQECKEVVRSIVEEFRLQYNLQDD
jgi:hypothetical protein